eukprot:769821-Prymnesium_polylepis.1
MRRTKKVPSPPPELHGSGRFEVRRFVGTPPPLTVAISSEGIQRAGLEFMFVRTAAAAALDGGAGRTQQMLRCGDCAAVNAPQSITLCRDSRHCTTALHHGPLPSKAWQGVRAQLSSWVNRSHAGKLEASTTTSHSALFAELPNIDDTGTLRFALHPPSVSLLPCYTTCVSVTFRWLHSTVGSGTSHNLLKVYRDPCGAENSCRSYYFDGQLRCAVGLEWGRLFSRFDEQLTW